MSKELKRDIAGGLIIAFATWLATTAWQGTRGELDKYDRAAITDMLVHDDAFRVAIAQHLSETVEKERNDLNQIRSELESSKLSTELATLRTQLLDLFTQTLASTGPLKNALTDMKLEEKSDGISLRSYEDKRAYAQQTASKYFDNTSMSK